MTPPACLATAGSSDANPPGYPGSWARRSLGGGRFSIDAKSPLNRLPHPPLKHQAMTEPSFEALLAQVQASQPAAMSGDVDWTPILTAALRVLLGWLGGMSAGSADAQGMLAALISEAEQR